MRSDIMRTFTIPCGIVAAVCVVALCGGLRARAAEPATTAKELYRQALTVMNDLKEPAFVTYRLEGTSEGLRVDWNTDQSCDRRTLTPPSVTVIVRISIRPG